MEEKLSDLRLIEHKKDNDSVIAASKERVAALLERMKNVGEELSYCKS
jgi:hypothetical protein